MGAGARALVRPSRFKRIHKLRLDRVPVEVTLLVHFFLSAAPAGPLPLLWAVAHESAFVAVDGDEDVWALSGHGVFEPAPGARALAVVRTRPVVFGLEVAELAVALVPAVAWKVLDERVLGWEAAAWADVFPRFYSMIVLVPVVLLEVLGGRRVYRVHGCLAWRELDVYKRFGVYLEAFPATNDLYRSRYPPKVCQLDFALHCAYVCNVDLSPIKPSTLARHLSQSMIATPQDKEIGGEHASKQKGCAGLESGIDLPILTSLPPIQPVFDKLSLLT